MQMLVLSDDLTGALEVGAKFAQAGVSVEVRTKPPDVVPDAEILVIDTETRHRPSSESRLTVRALAEELRARVIYKKTDSTLRGNIGAELQGLADAYPEAPILYSPAYPQLGRTVNDGKLYVNGMPIERTAFAHDILNPVMNGDVVSSIQPHLHHPVSLLDAGSLLSIRKRGVHVYNAETDDHLSTAARFLAARPGLIVAAGSAGLAGELAKALSFPPRPPVVRPVPKRALVVQGSLHERSIEQARYGEATGWRVLRLPDRAGDPLDAAFRLGKIVQTLLLGREINVLTVFGGDTAYGIIQAMEHPPILPMTEIVPGVAASMIGDNLILVTKAGGFGAVDVLDRIREWLLQAK
jgi:uncharacterized protein YgbK (DUF1537 family)